MPFTLSHAAAALPFRRWRLVTSAMVMGTFAPDFEYFLRLSPEDRFGHTLPGTFILTLPLALAVLWMFHRVVKAPAAALLPQTIERRLQPHLAKFHFGGPARFLLILLSLLLGIATHLLWDSFTHANTWVYKRWSFLREPIRLPVLEVIPCYKLLQHGSSIVGLGILAVWFVWWYRSTTPATLDVRSPAPLSPAKKLSIMTTLIAVALTAAMVRALLPAIGGNLIFKNVVAEAVVTVIAVLWWQLVAYGVFSARTQSDSRHQPFSMPGKG